MDPAFRLALQSGSERIAAWAELLDAINVFPVADGDTGRNLSQSLLPLRSFGQALSAAEIAEALLLAARGNSGNIAAHFLAEFVVRAEQQRSEPLRPGPQGSPAHAPGQAFLDQGQIQSLAEAARRGRELAWRAVPDPRPGTMLSLLDAFVPALENERLLAAQLDALAEVVRKTRLALPVLAEAGVVDAGALGLYLFFEGFLHELAGQGEPAVSVAERFAGALALRPKFRAATAGGYCVDAVLRARGQTDLREQVAALGEAAVLLERDGLLKVHLHARDESVVRARLARLGEVVCFCADDLGAQTRAFEKFEGQDQKPALHLITDAAGSLTSAQAREYSFTLLSSVVLLGDRAVPEIHLQPEELYAAMRRGVRVSTAQASLRERYQHYQTALERHGQALYLSVGAVFTGNHAAASAWKQECDPDGRLALIDSEAASGKLGLMALAVARRSLRSADPAEVLDLARRARAACEEWIFLDTLKYLAKGGRLSKAGALFGNMLQMKPVVSPTAEGAKKVAVVHNSQEQLAFARERLACARERGGPLVVMLEVTDNQPWVEAEVLPALEAAEPDAEIFLEPMSLTSGVHMGPGTWALACLPRELWTP